MSIRCTHFMLLGVILLTTHADVTAQQEIPLGAWRMHVSFNTIRSIAMSREAVYAASSNGVMIVNREDNSMTTYTRLNGLSGIGITVIGYDELSAQLIIAYEDGTFDVLRENKIRHVDPSRNTVITGSKKINGIAIHNQLAYLSADYGVLVFDLVRSEIQETWRDIGVEGATLRIYNSSVLGDTIFLATDQGILAGDLSENLLDFRKWKRFNTGEFTGPVEHIAAFNQQVYAVVNTSGIFRYEGATWHQQSYLTGTTLHSLEASANHLVIAADATVGLLDKTGAFTAAADETLTSPLIAKEDIEGILWIGDDRQGLIAAHGGTFTAYLPNGPTTDHAFRLHYNNNKMFLLPGGYASGAPLQNEGTVSTFEQGVWTHFNVPMKDLTDIALTSTGKYYLASFGHGVEERDQEGNAVLYDETNSPLVNVNPPDRFVTVSALHYTADGLWVANHGATPSLHHLAGDNTWQSFSFPMMPARYPVAIETDYAGRVWQVLDPAQGGGILVYDPATQQHHYLTEQNNQGELPSRGVSAIAVDRDGYVWVGTSTGAAYFFDPSSDAVRPIYENRFLLNEDKITAIAVDGGNRKWIGTERGAWLFNPTGEESIYHFTTANSPLLSDNITDIAINHATGEVFFATDRGVVSYRSNSTASTLRFQQVKIFPNPVLGNFTGEVGISGLATDAVVKITDVSGRLIWQTRANGGTASWNVTDYRGRRVSPGVFLIFAATEDGRESMVGKIAVVK